MKKILKIAGFGILLLVALLGAAIVYIKTAMPDVGPPKEIKIDATEARIARGKYLAWSVCVCMDCHSTRDWSKFSGPITPGKLGQGGERFDHGVGLPGSFYSKNITPAGISRYTDGELFRVITTGVTKEGKALFPIMPYPYYSRMDEEDVMSVIAYLRTLESVSSDVQESSADFPVNIIMNTMPKPASPMIKPDPSDQLAYGKYLITIGSCVECHTPFEKGSIDPALSYAGGREFPMRDGGVVRSANITQDGETGIGKWTADQFVARFKMFADSSYVAPDVKDGEFNTVMPWTMYATMEESDLKAIYAYLKTVEPINHEVKTYSAPASKP